MTLRRAALFAPALLAALLHLPTLGNGFVFDDRGVILENPLMQRAGDLPRLLVSPYWPAAIPGPGLYRPLPSLTFSLNRTLAGGFHPAAFHGVNVLLHALVTSLFVRLALLVLGAPLPALAAGLVFAVHPVHTEAVAGVVGRAELLAAAAVLATLLLHAAALSRPGRDGDRLVILVPLMALLAMLSKESAFVVPILCLLLEVARGRRVAGPRRRWMLYGGLAIAVCLALLLRLAVLGGPGMGKEIPFVDNPAASAGPVTGRITALGCVARYALLLAWPARLSADYSYDQIPVLHSVLEPWAMSGALLVALVLGAGCALLRRRPAFGFALLFVAVSFATTSNLVGFIGTLLAERLLYLPSVGACLLVGAFVGALEDTRFKKAVLGMILLVSLLGLWRTVLRLPDWKDDFSLYRSAAEVSPRAARIRYNLGNAYLRQGRFGEAESQYRTALGIYEDFGDAWANLGMSLLQQGRWKAAEEALLVAARRLPRNAEVSVNLGSAYRSMGDPGRAVEQFQRALSIDPRAATAWNNLGSLALARGDTVAAIRSLEQAIQIAPQFGVYRLNLADAYMAAGRSDEAGQQFREAYRLDPERLEVIRGLGEAELLQGDRVAAERAFRAAASGDPPSARAANYLGYLLATRGDREGAIAAYEKALSLDPSLHDAERSLGLLHADDPAGRTRAVAHLKRSLALAPDQPEAELIRRRLRELGATDRSD